MDLVTRGSPRGFKRGETAAIMLPTCADFFYAFFGVSLAGGIAVPIYPPARPKQIEEYVQRQLGILRNAEVRFLISWPQAKPVADVMHAGLPSLMVLTGVSTARDAVYADVDHRPDYIAADLRALLVAADGLAVAEHPAWAVDVNQDAVTITATGSDPGSDDLSVVRATARAVWDSGSADAERQLAVLAGDDVAQAALRRWSLLTTADRLA